MAFALAAILAVTLAGVMPHAGQSGHAAAPNPESYTLAGGAWPILDSAALLPQYASAQVSPDSTHFVTTWMTYGINESVTIPVRSSLTYNYTVIWGDGDTDTGLTGNAVHKYTTAGNHQVRIYGTYPQIYLNGDLDASDRLVSIDQWGSNQWVSMHSAFQGAEDMIYTATDTPDLSAVTTMRDMFLGAASFDGNLSDWDVSGVTDMGLMFRGAASFNGDLSDWNVSGVTRMNAMFQDADSFNGDISDWGVSGVTEMSYMFYRADSFDGDLSDWNVSGVTEMASMFENADSFNGDISSWNVSGVDSMSHMFSNADSFNGDISDWDVSGVNRMDFMLNGADSFNQNLGNWYIVLDDTAIDLADAGNTIGSISAQNSVLDGHNFTYGLGSDSDSQKFAISGNDLQVKPGEDYSSRTYDVTITVTGAELFGTNNQRTVGVTVAGTTSSDATPPVITLEGPATLTIEAGTAYNDQGATCTDTVDGAITPTPAGEVDTGTPGDYTIAYSCVDAAGNQADPVSRTVTVQDTTAPAIDLTGPATLTIEAGTAYNDQGATCTDTFDGAITPTPAGEVDTGTPGDYTITYSCVDAAGNRADQVSRTVTVEAAPVSDTTSPTLALIGSDSETITVGASYTDAGATCTDTVDGAITPTSSGTVDASQAGTYTVTYSCRDAAGNSAPGVSRIVTVEAAPSDSTPPTLRLTGSASTAITVGASYTDAGATCTDTVDGIIEPTSTDNVDTSHAGTYTVTYSCRDAAGNSAPGVSRIVTVEAAPSDSTPPTLRLTGSAFTAITVGASYTDAGATCTDTVDGIIEPTSTDNVDTSHAGTYTVTYSCRDAAGNSAPGVSRIVTVEAAPSDSTPPTLRLTGSAFTAITVGASYTDAGATCTDTVDGTITPTSSGTVNTGTAGTYTVTYSCRDAAGNSAPDVSRIVIVSAAVINTGQNPPTFVSSTLNNVTGVLAVAFSEDIDATPAANVVPAKIHVRESGSYAGGITLSAGELDTTADGTVISFTLTASHLAAVNGLAVPELTIEPGAVKDTSGDLIVGTFDASTATFTDTAFPVSPQDSDPRGMAFSSDGTKMFLVDYGSADVNEYALSAPFDISAPVIAGDFSVSPQDSSPTDVAFSNDGTRMFVVGSDSRKIYEYALSAPFDISTAAFASDTPASQDFSPDGMAFSNDGTRMFVAGYSNAKINEYALSAPFDISTATFTDTVFSVSSQEAYPSGMAFSSDGTRMFVVGIGGIKVNEYALSAPFDISTPIFVDNLSVSSQDTYPEDLAFSNDGAKMFIVGYDGSDINEYALSSVYPITVTAEAAPVVPDTTVPVITLAGPASVTITVGATYDDEGATCRDDVDANLVPTVSADTVDAGTVGTYAVTYSCVDAAGNQADPVSRTVTVQDTTAPAIDLTGPATLTIEAGTAYNDQGATCRDDVDANLAPTVSADTVDAGTVGTYAVTYSCVDAAGNQADPVSRTVTVQDTTAPAIDLTGPATLTIEAGTAYNDQGATCTDTFDGAITPTSTGEVDTGTPRDYTIAYSCVDAAGNQADPVSRTVLVEAAPAVPDTTVPVITLAGPASVTITVGATYDDEGAACTDDVDASLAPTVSADTVDAGTVGTYAVTYACVDAAGNQADPVSRTVLVEAAPAVPDTTVPVITLAGPASVTITVGATYDDEGAACTDDVDASLAPTVSADTVDAGTVGTYAVTYACVDAAGNQADPVSRTVLVEAAPAVPDTTVPVITLAGPASVTITVGATYDDEGAACTDDVDGTIPPTSTDNVDTSQAGTYTLTYSCRDAAGNDAPDVSRIVTVSAAVINTGQNPPTFVSSTLNNVTGVLEITFSEDIDATPAASVVPDRMHIRESGSYAAGVTLSAGELATTADGTVVSFTLTAPHLAAVNGLAVPELTIEPGAVKDTSGDLIVGTFDVSTAVFADTAFSVSTQDSNPRGMAFSSDGTKMFVTGFASSSVNEYTLSAPFDISAPVIAGDFSVSTQDPTPTDVALSSDGTRMFVVGYFNEKIYEYALATAFSVSPATFASDTSVSQDFSPDGMAFSNDGTKMFMVGDAKNSIYEYALSEAFDVSTATFTDTAFSVAAQETSPTGMAFSSDGTKMFVVGINGIKVNEYTLSAPFDISTPIFVGNFSVSFQDTNPEDLAFSSDGAKMFIVGNDGNDISEYALSSVYPITVTAEAAPAVPDTTAPAITLAGPASVTITVGATYDDEGAACTDDVDASLVPTISADTVDAGTVGTYAVTYACVDAANNQADPVSRIVIVEAAPAVPDTTAPAITLAGPASVTITVGATYDDEGAACTDDVDASLAPTISADTVDAGTAGTYAVTYACVDAANNQADPVSRTVIVEAAPAVPDTTAPAITLAGPASVTITVGATYDDEGAACTDDVDASLAPTISADTVDAGTVGTYAVTYSCVDAANNQADPVSRTVIVEAAPAVPDTTAPAITLAGPASVTITVGATYDDEGAACTDDVDASLAPTISADTVDAGTVGTYAVTYSCVDAANNQADPVSRTVIVEAAPAVPDTTAPAITLAGPASVTITVGATYDDEGAACTDDVDASLVPTISADTVDAGTVGTYAVTYACVDAANNQADPVSRTVIVEAAPAVPDTTAPAITLAGPASVTITVGATYDDEGAACTDDVDASLAPTISADTVDAGTVGTYAVTYSCVDAANNQADPVSRTVIVEAAPAVPDTTAPAITLAGPASVTITVGATYDDEGAACTDDVDASLAPTISADTVDAGTVGTYAVTYSCVDAANNQADPVSRTVIVEAAPAVPDTTAPAITLAGPASVTITVGATYDDEGAACTDDVDGTIPPTSSGTVDTSQAGTYTLTYSCRDAAGNDATPVEREVIVSAAVINTGQNPPTFVSSTLSNVTGVLEITFSEDIDATPAASVVPAKIHVRESGSYAGGVTLSAGELATTVDGTVISFTLTASHLAAVNGLAVPELTIEPGAVKDTSGNLIVGTFDASTATFTDTVFPVSPPDSDPRGMAFSSDGTKMFVVDYGSANVNEYTLSAPFDISAPVIAGDFSVSTQDSSPTDVAFSNDGTRMFVVGSDSRKIYEYALTTPFNVSTATFASDAPASQDFYPDGMAFSNDGTRMFVAGYSNAKINEYALSAPFDISTATFTDTVFSVSSQETFPSGMAFSNDGTRMFVVGIGGIKVNEYALSAPFDISTPIFVDNLSVSSQDTYPEDLAFSNDGTKMFIVGYDGSDINEYTLSSVYPITVTADA